MTDRQDGTGALRTAFLDGMSPSAASVSVVTTDGPAGRGGVTVLGDDLDLGGRGTFRPC